MTASALLPPSLLVFADESDDRVPIQTRQPSFPAGLDFNHTSPEELQKKYEGGAPPESVRMYLAIMDGSLMGSGEGWFGPSDSRFSWKWLAERHGIANDGAITREQFRGPEHWFNQLDRDHNGNVTADDLDWADNNPWVRNAYLCNRLFRKIDPRGDGRLKREEWIAFFDKAAGMKDSLTAGELRDAWLAGMTSGFLPGDKPSQEQLLDGLLNGDLGSLQEGPALDAPAPDFLLSTVDGDDDVQLADVIGKKPVVLVFGNFTCSPFRSMYPEVDAIAQRFKDEAEFLAVYVREAHPSDGWLMLSNTRVGVETAQPKTYGDRRSVAARCSGLLKPSILLLVDDARDSVGHAYSGMPARLYVIDRAGKIAYKGGRGPFGFKAGEMEQALVMTLLSEQPLDIKTATGGAAPIAHSQPRLALPTSEEAWQRLPEVTEGKDQPLPNWARALAPTSPYLTAAMLELDHTYRTTPHFSPRERGLIRSAVARINRSAYGLAYANAALKEGGVTDDQIAKLDAGDVSWLSEPEQRMYSYAAQASKAARDLTDSQVASLREELGDDRLVGLVLQTAYANFQDRFVHALALPLEDGGPLRPVAVKFGGANTPGGSNVPAAERPEIPTAAEGAGLLQPEWSDFTFQTLQLRLEKQRDREPRVSIPTWEEMIQRLPKGLYNPDQPLRIRWSRLVIGRQPEMGSAWVKCLRVFGNEAHQDRVFEESAFWVVTRELRCFYCMGHCEMLMEVGGITPVQIADSTEKMAYGDWSEFSPSEQATFSLASTMTKTPWAVTDTDFKALEAALGHERAVDAIWWISRCQFMTKVSDTFQLQLERDNVFHKFEPPKEKK
jgi:alkylhydroperoxidase family enzyme